MTNRGRIENGGFLLFLTIITIALGVVVSAFAAALLWSGLAAILFQPLYQKLLKRWPERRNLAASLAMLIIFIAVVVPTLVIASMMIDQATSVYGSMQGGQINFSAYFKQVHDALPDRLHRHRAEVRSAQADARHTQRLDRDETPQRL